MDRSLIIVGAGIAGLATGCYARMNGYHTTILEMHTMPGGLCTAWTRNGYTFDTSMHMLVGSKSGPLRRMWEELDVVGDRGVFYKDEVIRVEGHGKKLTISADPRRLEDRLVALSAPDAKLSREFVRLVSGRNMMGALSLTPSELTGMRGTLKMLGAMLPLMPTIIKYGKTTLQDFAARFRDPFLRDAVRFFIDSPGWPMLQFPMAAMSGMLEAGVLEAGAPLGGSKAAIDRMVALYEGLGGEIRYRHKVTDLLIESDRTVGVRLADDTELRGDDIVWAGDGHAVIFDILGGRYLDKKVRSMYEEWTPVLPVVQVMIGVARDMSDEPHNLVFEATNPVTVAGEERRWLTFLHRGFDPTTAPPGKSAVEVWYATPWEYWEELDRDRSRYKEERRRIADETIAELDRRWPGFAADVEVVDVPTPATYARYTGNWRGSPDGWYMTPQNMANQTPLRSLPGLAGFHMVGQWTCPFAGTVMSALSGRQLVELLCARDGVSFSTAPR
ncbi:MAG: NAD(P)-binding protein [Spirochaetes bacterium]|jgi:phytoene dehydrogenase-like protein|nr:NAD(P)-binding protein [Spirochaetota bacterium]